jgi:tetratricopeptide (TPR) repeat protein
VRFSTLPPKFLCSTICVIAMNMYRLCVALSILLLCGILIGCSGSNEAQHLATIATVRDSVATLRAENDSLKRVTLKLGLDNRTSISRITELETQLADLRQKLNAPTPPVPPPKPHITDPRATYMRALEEFRARKYADAAATFQSVLEAEAPVQLQDNCYYWQGECAYGEKKYAEAIEHFQKVFTFKWSEKKDDAQIMIANSYYAIGNKPKAKEAYERLVKKFPASPYVKKAKARLVALK